MRAVLLAEDARVEVGSAPTPELSRPGDALVAVSLAGICGSDLHVKQGRVAGALPGLSLGHEFTGVVTATGPQVHGVAPGDRVVGSFVMPCARCPACAGEEYHLCEDQAIPGYGMFFGDHPGTQAEVALARNADLSLLRIPDGVDEGAALLVGDNLTTAYYANRIAGVGEGTFVAVQGCGPVGLLAVQVALASGADPVVAVDVAPARLEHARRLGARTIDVSRSSAGVAIERFGGGRGADVVLDTAGGDPALLVQALDLVRPGGTLAVVGVYAAPEATLPLAEMWLGGITLRFSSTSPVPALWREVMDLLAAGSIDPRSVITHRLPLGEAARGYELCERRESLKVLLEVAGSGAGTLA